MKNSTIIQNNLELEQSELFGSIYQKNKETEIQTFNEVSINDIDDWYNSLSTKYSTLDLFQIDCLNSFFYELKNLLKTIDPNKLDIQDDLIENSDLMLWRESPLGISKLIFDEYGQIVYMFNGNEGKKIKGTFDISVDFEKLLYRFISL